MPSRRHERERWSIHAEWRHGVEPPGDSIRGLQRFLAAISKIAPVFSQFVVSPGEELFSSYSQRRLVNVLKRNPVKETEIRNDPNIGYRMILVVPPTLGVQSGVDLTASFCHMKWDNKLILKLGDITRPMFASLRARDWAAIIEQLALIFDPNTVRMQSKKFWDILELRSIGWANYRSRRAVEVLPTAGFPAVIPVKDQGVLYLCSRELSGRMTNKMIETAWKLKAALEPPQKRRGKRG